MKFDKKIKHYLAQNGIIVNRVVDEDVDMVWDYPIAEPNKEILDGIDDTDADETIRIFGLSKNIQRLQEITTADESVIVDKKPGMIVWNTDLKQVRVYDGSNWVSIN